MQKRLGQYTIIQSQNSSILTAKQAASSNFKGLSMLAQANMSDIMFVSFILFHEGGNDNGDYLTREEMERIWPSFAGKPITWAHGQPYIGFITDAILVKPSEDSPDPRWYVKCGGVIWKARYPNEASAVLEGAQLGTYRMSFEIYFQHALYMLGNDQKNLYTAEEAPYLVPLVGRQYKGQAVWRVLMECLGGGAGVTRDPADEDALILSAASEKPSVDVQIDYEKCVAHIKSIENLVEEVSLMNKLDEQLEQLNTKVASLEETVATLREEKTALEEAKAALEASNAELEAAKAELEAYKEEAESVKTALEEKLASVQSAFDAYKEQIEHEKAEAAKDALAAQRLTELKEGGVEMDEAQAEKWTSRLREMDEESYADLKDLLLANKASASADPAAPGDTEPTTTPKSATASLNLESVNKSLVDKYQKIWEKALSDNN